MAYKPDLVHVWVGLFKLYRLLLKNKGERQVAKMLITEEGIGRRISLVSYAALKKDMQKLIPFSNLC